jgi:hypothetical protein
MNSRAEAEGVRWLSDLPEYNAWQQMRQRCSNPNVRCYRHYGAVGIRVCDRWQTFENFLDDMGRRPSPQHSIDRIDVLGNYSPENCRWATHEEQQNNRRNNQHVTVGGRTQTVAEWARECGLQPDTIYRRLKVGDSAERAIRPVDHPSRRRSL